MEKERVSAKRRHKETLQRLRILRKETVQRVTAQVKMHKKTIASIMDALRSGPKTVPEIAEHTGLETQEALWWTASLKKYGLIIEGDKQGAYFTYRAPPKEAASGQKAAALTETDPT